MPHAPKSFQQVLAELWELLKAYAQQETIGPLKNLGRQIGFGFAGTLMFCLGYFLIVLGVMRFLQTQTHGFFVDFSVHNYLSYLVGALMLVGACVWAGKRAKGPTRASGSADAATMTGRRNDDVISVESSPVDEGSQNESLVQSAGPLIGSPDPTDPADPAAEGTHL